MVATAQIGNPKGVMNCAGWAEFRTPEEFNALKEVENESQGTKHVPLQHWQGMDMFCDRLDSASVAVKSHLGMLSPNQQKFIYMAEVADANLPDLSFMLGFISFNDRTRSVQVAACDHVFVCSNLTFHGFDKNLRQKHLSNVHDGTAQIFDAGIEQFNAFRDSRLKEINAMKQIEIDRTMQGNLLLDMMHSDVFGGDPGMVFAVNKQFEKPVHDEFTDRSLWHFNNAATEEFKKISVGRRLSTDAELGRILANYMK